MYVWVLGAPHVQRWKLWPAWRADADELFYEGGKGKLAVRNFVKVSGNFVKEN